VFLKSLTIKGFKSFADAATLDLEPGVTVIVGPNGSGKSNVVDAIAWVLGAQAPSAVRSQKMDDVIFAGTATRAALGRAEVTLTIDNSAGLLPVDLAEITVTRVLFRNGDSEYLINGAPCRLLDVQELLSDAGVGRQQHVIISQGQIDAVLNSRPEERRQIVEEAAGVLKFRKRKEKAERRLASTETDLNRLQDLLREVRRQLRPLERQAQAAARHGSLADELHALRLHQAGRELSVLREAARTQAAERIDLQREERNRRDELARLDGAVFTAEARLSALGGDDLGDTLVRYESLRERARGQLAVLVERRRGIEREREASAAREVVANLEGEANRLGEELLLVERQAEELLPEAERVAAAEDGLAELRRRFQEAWADGAPTSDGRAAEVRGELGALRSSVLRSEAEREKVGGRIADLDARAHEVAAQLVALRETVSTSTAAVLPLTEAVDAAERARREARSGVETAEAEAADAQAAYRAWAARVEALALALDQARARTGAERLADVEGVLGTLLDLVDVDAGWEAAFAAAAGEALAAVVVHDVDAARRALRSLRSGEVSGAVLALGAGGLTRPTPALGLGEPVRAHVRPVHPEVGPLLDVILGSVLAVDGDVLDAVELAVAHPEVVVVTMKGDRLGPSGWRVGTAATEATGAALREATDQLAEAEAHRASRRAALDLAKAARQEADRVLADATRDRSQAERRRDDALAALRKAEARERDLATERGAVGPRVAELEERLVRERGRVAELAALLPELEAAEELARSGARSMAEQRKVIDERAAAVGALRRDLEVRAAGLEERRQVLHQRLARVEEQLARHEVERREAAVRRQQLDRQDVATAVLQDLVGVRLVEIEAELDVLRDRRRRQSEESRAVAAELDQLRRERTAAEKALEQLRERAGRVELAEAETRLRIETAVESIRRELDREPEQAMAAPCPPLPDGIPVGARIRELERELKMLGPINPLAVEEFAALQERHEFLQAQLEDIRATRRELRKVIQAVDEEIVSVFASAYADVATNFETLFSGLFPGGTGRLRLTEPEHLLETGIEVEAKPSGKNVKKLSLLSGGERSLTALAFLFAVFRSRPSPFYVMDEVEAALDDLNLHRFLGLVGEFRDEAQLLIVSHQKRTMEAADCLYGVSMQPGGSSKVVSERVTARAGADRT
jgi:chromosome segregation protein